MSKGKLEILHMDNYRYLRELPDESIDFFYIDPPFNTGRKQKIHGKEYCDSIPDYPNFIRSRLYEVKRTLKPTGSLFFHIDDHWSHYCKIYLDDIFGRASFRNEIIWSYDYGGRAKNAWSRKHDTLFWYSKDRKEWTYNYDEIERIPYMAPSLVGEEKAARGKTPTDVWWHTIVPTNGKERVDYPTQKPLGVMRWIVNVHTNPGDLVVDLFAGSGSFAVSATQHNRNCIAIDTNPDAIDTLTQRVVPNV